MDLNIVLISNGPGELATWVKPLLKQLRQSLPQARVVVALVPCPHSSGQEKKYAQRLYGAYTMAPEETLQYLLTGKLPKGLAISKHGVILQLGGDTLFGVSFRWRSGFPLAVYTENLVQWKRQVSRFYFKNTGDHERARLTPQQGVFVGDLMQDAVRVQMSPPEIRKKLQLRPDAPVVTLLPGSKPLKVLFSTAFFVSIVEEISLAMPDVQFILLQSAFTPLNQIRDAVQDPKYLSVLNGTQAKMGHYRGGSALITPQGNKIQIITSDLNYAAMQISDLSLTLPGTNTAELASLGCPMLVLLPLQRPELLPLDGILQYLDRVPYVGKSIKKALVLSQLKKIPFLALPNQKAGKMIASEYRGELSPETIAKDAVKLLTNDIQRREMSRSLRETMPVDQSAERICKNLVALLKETYPELESGEHFLGERAGQTLLEE